MTTMHSSYANVVAPQFTGFFSKPPTAGKFIKEVNKNLQVPSMDRLKHPTNNGQVTNFKANGRHYRFEASGIMGMMMNVTRLTDVKRNVTLQSTGAGCFGVPSMQLLKGDRVIEEIKDRELILGANDLLTDVRERTNYYFYED